MDEKNPSEMAAIPPPCYMCKITFSSFKGPLRSEEKYCKKLHRTELFPFHWQLNRSMWLLKAESSPTNRFLDAVWNTVVVLMLYLGCFSFVKRWCDTVHSFKSKLWLFLLFEKENIEFYDRYILCQIGSVHLFQTEQKLICVATKRS